ncbi:MAG: chromosome segregation protein SMC [Alteromonadaceae bacterium]|nr:MAG: chromosome segregation protein SMC [Alteromonadaceae bacterium]
MQIDKLDIKNFKLFSEAEFSLDSRFNLIIGENGSGKTSLLSAIAIALGGWAHAYIKDSKNLRPIEDNEIREVQIDNTFDKTKETHIKATGKASVIDRNGERKGVAASWHRTRLEGSDKTYTSGSIQYGSYPQIYTLHFETLGADILRFIESGNDYSLPLIAFYECNRLWLPKNELNAEASAKAKYSRFDPYVDCFHTAADHQAVGEWILKHELASIQQNKETPVLSAIKAAARAALEGCTGLQFDFEKSRIILAFENGDAIPFEHLSDGQRTMLGLFCDLARRAAILNPHLKSDASEKTKGVVLIDELDLHLHPKWQRRIIENLQTCFPNLQFICTTHSPFLIQSLREGKLIQLGDVSESNFYDSSIEDIVEDIQGVTLPQKSQRYTAMMNAAKTYYKALNDAVEKHEDVEALKQALDELTIPYGDDPAFSAQLKFERELALAKKGK